MIQNKSLKWGVFCYICFLCVTFATPALSNQQNTLNQISNKSTTFSVSELKDLGASTIEESMVVLKNITNAQDQNSKEKKVISNQGKEIKIAHSKDLSSIINQLSLEDLDHIEVSHDGNQIKYHLTKSLSKEGLTALFSFSLIEDTPNKNSLNPIVNTVSKAPVKLNKISDIVQVIQAEELETLGISSIEEALNLVGNGIVADTSGVKSVFLRGLPNGNTKVLFNGVDLKDAMHMDGSPNFNFIPIKEVKQIEVLSGSNAIVNGSGSSGGIINIITKEESNQSYVSSLLGQNEFNSTIKKTFKVGQNTGYVLGSKAYNNNLSAFKDKTEKDAYSQESITAALNTKAYYGSLKAFASVIRGSQELDSTAWSPTGTAYFDDPDYVAYSDQSILKLDYEIAITPKTQSYFKIGHHGLNRRYKNKADATNSNTDDSEYNGQILTLELNNKLLDNGQSLLFIGSDFRKETGSSKGESGGWSVEQKEKSQKSLAVFTQYRGNFNWISTQVGGRYEYYGRDSISSYEASLFRQIPVIDTQIKGTVKTGFKLPSLYQRYSSYGNPDLVVETSETQELSFQKELNNIKFQYTLYNSDIQNKISWGEISPGKNGYINQKSSEANPATEISGNEYSVEMRNLKQLSFLRADYTTIKTNEQNSKIPGYKGAISAGLSFNKWNYGMFFNLVGASDRYDDYHYIDLSVNYKQRDNVNLFAKVHNVFDQSYEIEAEYSEPGRTVLFGINLAI